MLNRGPKGGRWFFQKAVHSLWLSLRITRRAFKSLEAQAAPRQTPYRFLGLAPALGGVRGDSSVQPTLRTTA